MENKDNNQKNMILAVILSVAVLYGSTFFMPKAPKPKASSDKKTELALDKDKKDASPKTSVTKTEKKDTQENTAEKVENKETDKSLVNNQKEEFLILENKDSKVKFSTYGASIKEFNLKGKKYTLDKAQKEQIFLIKEAEKEFYPLSFSIMKDTSKVLNNYIPFEVSKKDDKSLEFTFKNNLFKIVKTYTLQGKYSLKLDVKIKNISSETQEFKTITNYSSFYDKRVEKTSIFGNEGKTFFYKTNHGDFERVESDDFKNEITKKDLLLMGVDDRYFISLLKPSHKDALTFKINKKIIKKESLADTRFTFESDKFNLESGKSTVLSYEIYNGPKILSNLEKLGAGDGIDYGIFAVISQAILWLLLFLYNIFGNYGLSLILLTLIVKVGLYPLTKSSYASMHKMKKLKPEMDKLKEKYGDDREKIGRETMAMYKKHGVSPLGGCLPMLLQMPIWFGLYRAIQYSVELYNEPFFLWIHDLSVADPYYILPVTMGILMFFQQKLSSANMDQTQAKIMLYTMPVLFSFFMINLPSGLVLYIWVNTLVSILQQNYINKKLDRQEAAGIKGSGPKETKGSNSKKTKA